MKPRTVHHIAIKAAKPRELAAFYSGVLGLEEQSRHQDEKGLRSVWMTCGETILMIERSETVGDSDRRFEDDPPGQHLVAFSVANQEKEAWRAHLGQHRVAIVHETKHTLYLLDPESNRIGLSSWPD